MSYSKILLAIVQRAETEFRQISESEFSEKPNVEGWSKKEILGHLIDSAMNNNSRFIRSVGKGNLIFEGYDQVQWVELNGYQLRNKNELIKTWKALNMQIVRLIERIPEGVMKIKHKHHSFDQICMCPVLKTDMVNLDYLVWDYIYHLEHHLNQIISGFERQFEKYGDIPS